MYILSLDCSTKSTGYALFYEQNLIDYGVFKASHSDPIKRIKSIVKEMQEYIIKQQGKKIIVDKIVVEEVRPDTEQQYKSVHTHKILMYLQAAVALMLDDLNIGAEIIFLYPSEWRKTVGIKTGAGIKRAELKQEDIKTANQLFNLNTNNDDIADACLMGYAFYETAKSIEWAW